MQDWRSHFVIADGGGGGSTTPNPSSTEDGYNDPTSARVDACTIRLRRSDRREAPLRGGLSSFAAAQAPTVVFEGQSMNARPTIKAALTARMNRYQGVK